MTTRDPALQTLLDLLVEGIAARAGTWPGGPSALERVRDALSLVVEPVRGGSPPEPPPVVPVMLELALADAQAAGGYAAAVGKALSQALPQITWYLREGLTPSCEDFADRHALATLIGPSDRLGVLEVRDDVRVGISLVAPRTEYPDHRHPPEELYLALTPGEWRQDLGPWFEPGPGGVVFNTSNILHGMRAGASPQLALWCLPS
jgi:hypothetical protein